MSTFPSTHQWFMLPHIHPLKFWFTILVIICNFFINFIVLKWNWSEIFNKIWFISITNQSCFVFLKKVSQVLLSIGVFTPCEHIGCTWFWFFSLLSWDSSALDPRISSIISSLQEWMISSSLGEAQIRKSPKS